MTRLLWRLAALLGPRRHHVPKHAKPQNPDGGTPDE